MPLRRYLAIFGVLALVALHGPAAAQDARGAAEKHLREGAAFFAAQKYDLALIEFLACYSLSAEPDILHNISLTYEKLKDYAKAIDYERRLIAEKGSALTSAELDEANGRIVRLTSAVAPIAGPAPPPAIARKSHIRLPFIPIAAGAALIVASIACGIASHTASEELHDGTPRTQTEIDRLLSRGLATERAGVALGSVGAASALAGGIWLVIEYRR